MGRPGRLRSISSLEGIVRGVGPQPSQFRLVEVLAGGASGCISTLPNARLPPRQRALLEV